MLTRYHILTVTHKQVPLNLLGGYFVPGETEEERSFLLNEAKEALGIDELMYTVTCNRALYFFTTDHEVNGDFKMRFFRQFNQSLAANQLNGQILHFQGKEALRHLFNVASSIDSMVVGEREILRQIRTSFETCRKTGLTGDNIRLAVEHCIPVAKRVFTSTKIAEKPVSVVSLAYQELSRRLNLNTSGVMLVGAGQTARSMMNYLMKGNVKKIFIYNRSLENAAALSEQCNGQAFKLDQLELHSASFDAIICATASPKHLIDTALFDKINSTGSKKVLIDLSIPHNIDPVLADDPSIDLIQVSDLEETAKLNMESRKQEISLADEIIESGLVDFKQLYLERQVEIALSDIPGEIKQIRRIAVEEVFKKDIESLDEHAQSVVMKMLSYMEKKCISVPMKKVKLISQHSHQTIQ